MELYKAMNQEQHEHMRRADLAFDLLNRSDDDGMISAEQAAKMPETAGQPELHRSCTWFQMARDLGCSDAHIEAAQKKAGV